MVLQKRSPRTLPKGDEGMSEIVFLLGVVVVVWTLVSLTIVTLLSIGCDLRIFWGNTEVLLQAIGMYPVWLICAFLRGFQSALISLLAWAAAGAAVVYVADLSWWHILSWVAVTFLWLMCVILYLKSVEHSQECS